MPTLSTSYAIFSLFSLGLACPSHGIPDPILTAANNNKFRSIQQGKPLTTVKTAITNVRVFDGNQILPATTVVIDGATIAAVGNSGGATVQIDGKGGVLIPGLIDGHAHPNDITDLQDLTRYGVTTSMLMSCFQPQLCMSLKNHTGLVDIVAGSLPAAAPGSIHGSIVEAVDGNASRLISNASMAPQWLSDAVAWGPDFVKLIAESPGLDQQTLNVLASRSHGYRKRVVCHASDLGSYEQAVMAGVDEIEHAPTDQPITTQLASQIAGRGQVTTPTLAILKAITDKDPSRNYTAAEETVRRLKAAGIPIGAGTDANLVQGIVANVPFGISLHEELQLLVNAGLTPLEALRAATSVVAKNWGLNDRGVIAAGKRADLVLLSGNPLENITATRTIQKIWLAGVEFSGTVGTF